MEEFFGIFMFLSVLFLCFLTKIKDSSDKYKDSLKSDISLKNAWTKFAKSNNLSFKSGININPHVYGNYRGYDFSLRIESINQGKLNIGTIISIKRTKKLMNLKRRLDTEDIMHQFLTNIDFDIPGELKINDTHYLDYKKDTHYVDYLKISFESYNIIIRSADRLQSIADQLLKILEVSFNVWIGGENIRQAIQRIASETRLRIKPKIALLLCKKCLTFCSSHKVKLPSTLLKTVKAEYYGCRLCKQSRDFIKGRSIAVLDNQLNEKFSVRENEFQVNWLIYRKPFDFHEVRIIQTSDRDVEEFVMQAGNDMDEFHQPRYKEIPCIIASGCKLSENSLRILKNKFGEVLMK